MQVDWSEFGLYECIELAFYGSQRCQGQKKGNEPSKGCRICYGYITRTGWKTENLWILRPVQVIRALSYPQMKSFDICLQITVYMIYFSVRRTYRQSLPLWISLEQLKVNWRDQISWQRESDRPHRSAEWLRPVRRLVRSGARRYSIVVWRRVLEQHRSLRWNLLKEPALQGSVHTSHSRPVEKDRFTAEARGWMW